MTKEAMKLALEVLEGIHRYGLDTLSGRVDGPDDRDWQRAGVNEMTKRARLGITALREALAEQCQCPNCKVTLHASDCAVHNEPAYPKVACNCGAQPEKEPVAMRYDFDGYGYKYIDNGSGSDWKTRIKEAEPLYTSPPAQRTWVGLTDEEAFQICVDCGCLSEDWLTLLDAIEAKLKEKNS